MRKAGHPSKADTDGHCGDGPCPVFEETGVIVEEEAPAILGTTTTTATTTSTVTTETITTTATTTAEETVEGGGGRALLGLLGRSIGVMGGVLAFPIKLNPSEQESINRLIRINAALQTGFEMGEGAIEGARKSSKTLRREWEKAKGKKWPKDKSGNNYDADHKRALADKGSNNAARNITPRTRRDHIRRHKKNGDFKRWAKRAHQ